MYSGKPWFSHHNTIKSVSCKHFSSITKKNKIIFILWIFFCSLDYFHVLISQTFFLEKKKNKIYLPTCGVG